MTFCASPAVYLSTLIKAIRLRHVDLAVHSLGHLWSMDGDVRTRTRRRVLVCSAEDNTSVPVMSRVGDWFGAGGLDLQLAIREVMRICGTPNWYATPSGRSYIRAWWQAESVVNRYAGLSQTTLQATVEDAVRSHEALQSLQAFTAIVNRRDYSREGLAGCLRSIAEKQENDLAVHLADIFVRHATALWWDSNVSGQCLYTLLAGPIGSQVEFEPDEEQVIGFARFVTAQPNPPDVPSWCMDGIHVPGVDPRFSGAVKHMAAACTAYERFGRLSPDDQWESDDLLLARESGAP